MNRHHSPPPPWFLSLSHMLRLRARRPPFLFHCNLASFTKDTSNDRHLPSTKPTSPVDPSLLLLVRTALFKHYLAPDSKLHSILHSILPPSHLTHELFLQVCNAFPYSWRPIHRFYLFSLLHPHSFPHTPTSINKVLGVLAGSANVPLLWDFLSHASRTNLVNRRSYLLAALAFADGRQIKKLIGVFDLIKQHDGDLYDLPMLNLIVRELCRSRLAEEAMELVRKLRSEIAPDSETYGYIVAGLCRKGDLMGACNVWNMMLEGEMEPEVETYEELIVTFFKANRIEDAMRMFVSLRAARIGELGVSIYEIMIDWLSKAGRIEHALMVFDEMLKRGVPADGHVLGALVFGFFARRKVRDARKVVEGVDRPDIFLYHGLIKGFLGLQMVGEATEVFREMCRGGCEPTMHTYVMLLRGHLGKKGRRGKKGKDPLVNFDSIFVGGLVKAGKYLEATKYVERMLSASTVVPRFDYNNFLHCFSNEEGVVMFEEVSKRLREAGMVDLGDIFLRYGEKMATRDRRRRMPESEVCTQCS